MIAYILISTICLSLSYFIYLLLFRKRYNFKQARYYLLGAILMSLVMPFNNYQFDIGISIISENNSIFFNFNPIQEEHVVENIQVDNNKNASSFFEDNWQFIAQIVYLAICFFLLARIFIHIICLTTVVLKSEKRKHNNYIIVYSKKAVNNSSFLKWIFIHPSKRNDKNIDKVIAHEKIHASQYHSIDRIIIELLSAVMWFNPIIWKMKRSIELVHEYLADEGALGTGIDRLKYQALLLNHVTEEKLICVSSSFNHSLIKKRMLMISKNDFNQKTKLRILTLIPLAILLFLGVGIVNAQNTKDVSELNSENTSKKLPDKLVLKIGKITWTGNVLFTTKKLANAFEFKTGDKYDSLKVQKHLADSGFGVPGLYFDNGYALCEIKYTESVIDRNTINLDISIEEGPRCKFGKITIVGNKKVTDSEVFKRIKVKPGEWFTAKSLVESILAIEAMNKFDPEKMILTPNPLDKKANEDFRIIDFEIQLTEL